jgi:predicted ribosome quality control (RQC) complex YloA/Tae2 family protein
MQTSLHILSLVAELQREIVGAEIVSTEFYKKERAAFFFLKGKKSRLAFGFSYHPSGFGCYLVPASKITIETREKPWPVFDLVGGKVAGVKQLGFDRIIELSIDKDGEKSIMVIEAIGPNGNLWLLDTGRIRRGTLRKRKMGSGSLYEAPPLPDKINPLEITTEHVEKSMNDDPTISLGVFLEKKILGLNRTLAREVFARAELTGEPLTDSDVESLVKSVKWLADRFRDPEKGYLHPVAGSVEAYPFKLSTVADLPQKFKSISLAVLEMTRQRRTHVVAVDEKKLTLNAVGRAVKRRERLCQKVEDDLGKAEQYDQFRKMGELLKINFDKIKKGMKQIELDDVYSDDSSTTLITLDPALSTHQNVEAYFKKYRKGRDGHELLQRRLEISRSELEQLTKMLAALEIDFESARQRYQEELAALAPSSPKTQAMPAVRMPYREHILSSGLKIFIGRDGADNDRTTFEFAKPYELWFHAQQCPGSHVVIKYPNKSFQPSKREIEETAAIAAYHSKARNNSLVPVIYTERKYVRKPRKAKPGLVTVEREKSIMVAPIKPE